MFHRPVRTGFAAVALLLVALAPLEARNAPEPLVFEAILRGANVAPAAVETDATAVATAVLVGNTLTVVGSFTGLGSALRDIDETPEDPGIHIHPGARGETNPYLFGLSAVLNADGRSGIFSGRFTLTDDQVAMLRSGRIYIDIHTRDHVGGEVRDQMRAGGPDAGARARAILPVSGGIGWAPAQRSPDHCTAARG
jgi:hypothetical protein